MKIKDKLEALVEERIDYVTELVIRDRYDELYEVIYTNFRFGKLNNEEIEEQYRHLYGKMRDVQSNTKRKVQREKNRSEYSK